mgnify:CR=1 FL=1
MIISLILVLVYKNDFGYSLYWVITPLLILIILSAILKWSARGFDVDVNESKTIQRTFDDTTSLITVFFGFIFLAIHVVEIWNKDITKNSIVIIGFFIVMVLYELFTYLSIYIAKRDTAKLLEKNYNKKK